ncbi:MAG: YciI family protein [Oscillospiraceae bacterium]|nr:YciI family protein [Oscillospiraceae bacterium]
MRFVLLGFDGKDEGAMDRRMAARPEHMEIMLKFKEAGTLKYSGPLLDDDGKMIGSLMIHEYPSEQALRDDFLANEPYALQGVWETVTIYRHFPAEGRFDTVL